MPAVDFSPNLARFTGFADLYNRHRASPPAVLAELLARFSGMSRPALVIDLGCGTGLSTRYWADHAERVTGIEPTPDMIRQAATVTRARNVSYHAGYSHATGLRARCAQIACCMQALHWMEPTATFAEVNRILVRGGVFAACDYDWPPATGSWEADAAFESCWRTARELGRELQVEAGLQRWDKAGHLARMEASGCFRYVKEIAVHHIDRGNADRLTGLLLSQGFVQSLLKKGVTEAALGIPALRQIAGQNLGEAPRPFLWSARVRVGVT
ncbi:class I SAM-dependent methyltransferase [Opitutus sp. GAS368]|jgi:SAM-dependent methyltransferase|uniref:class I SAM-dependent methyltransferase n=1 Tax=Opitutus sp. GAS368 TaxID=1882749 RepID=UPI00087AF9D1|nr:class I SAM-dependent methyltransferase [Opitutus sp. GAS368]SDR89298.1 Methyltransferase domain-containing protein [Opitutus sp. GAS368]